MTDQTESASEYVPICLEECGWKKHTHAQGCPVPIAIRALEAKVRELEEHLARRDQQYAALLDGNAGVVAERDRLAGEVREHELAVISLTKALGDEQDRIARLTAELAAARENEARYLFIRDNNANVGRIGHMRPRWECAVNGRCYVAVTMDAAIDAARRAGGEG